MSVVPAAYRVPKRRDACRPGGVPAGVAELKLKLPGREGSPGQAPSWWRRKDKPLASLTYQRAASTGPMRLRGFEDEFPGRHRVERRLGEHLKGDPVQIRLPLPLQGEAAPQMLGAHHILQHRIAVYPEAEYDKGLTENRVLRVKGENLQRHIR